MKKLYKVGIYCRLSLDDASNSAKAKTYIPASESSSIENQREILSKFVMLNGWTEIKTYADDGYSGGNFQRPGFQKMLEDARKGLINLILVKDLSRLGRDFVEVGRYTDVVFPSLGCRFVSVLDCLDSEGDNTDMLHFRSLMNDYHLKDLSNKIKSVRYAKMKSGQFLSAYTPYGYQKSGEDKHKLVVDDYAADVVRRIFTMRQEGASYGKITAAMNTGGILSPRSYWRNNNEKAEKASLPLWTCASIKHILGNEVYLGNLLMNYTGSRTYKDSTMIRKPKSEWIRFEHAHEAIVSRDVWEVVQEINRAASLKTAKSRKPVQSLFSGKLVCADCKGMLGADTETHYRKNGAVKRYVSYCCGRHVRSGLSICSWHRIYEKTLVQIVMAEIQAHAEAAALDEAGLVETLKHRMARFDEQHLSDIRRESATLRRRLRDLEGMAAKLYEDKVSGAITESTFAVLIQKNEQEHLTKEEHLDVLLSEIGQSEQQTTNIQNWAAVIRKYAHLQTLDRETIDELIDHIEIGERTVIDGKRRQDVKVFYRFVGQVCQQNIYKKAGYISIQSF
ncbi:MAG: recombinase family protein [Ethanoligenens sp.]